MMWRSSISGVRSGGSIGLLALGRVGTASVMCRLALVLAFLCIQVRSSSESPPRVNHCRPIYKSKLTYESYSFSDNSGTCGEVVNFPIPSSVTINVTDTRNCENYYTCEGKSCLQCPCPLGLTFNPGSQRCDSTGSICVCPTTTSTTTSTTTTESPTTTVEIIVSAVVVNPAESSSQPPSNGDPDASDHRKSNSEEKDGAISGEVIIIAGIVSVTVIIVVVIVMAVFLWQKGRIASNSSQSPQKSPSAPSIDDGYSPAAPPSERHVYAEIDDRSISASKHWQHGGSMRAPPPLPNHQPPAASSSTTSSPFPNHHHLLPLHQPIYSDSGMGSVTDNSFATNCPAAKTTLAQKRYINDRPVHTCGCLSNDFYHSREVSSLSDESQYSHSVDSNATDMTNAPLHHGQPTTTNATFMHHNQPTTNSGVIGLHHSQPSTANGNFVHHFQPTPTNGGVIHNHNPNYFTQAKSPVYI